MALTNQVAKRTKWLGALLVAITGYFCFVQHRGDPPLLYWDENYHVTSAQRYVEGYAQLTPHPPLALLLIAGGELLSGSNRNIDKHVLTLHKQISGEQLPRGFDFSGMRLVPAVFAVFGALAFYALMLEISGAALPATLLCGLYLFENAFVVHFRAVHLEGIQMAFIVAALWLFVHSWKRLPPLRARRYAALTGLCTLAMLVKMNAAFLLILPLLLLLRDLHSPRAQGLRMRRLLGAAAASLATGVATVAAVVMVHLLVGQRLLPADSPAGSQDISRMSREYRDYASGVAPLSPALLWAATRDGFRNLGTEHLNAPHRRLNDPTENGSAPWHWPFHDRNITYRWDRADGRTAYIELAGNQLAWYCGTLAVIASLGLLLRHRLLRAVPGGRPHTWQLIECLTLLYTAFMLLNVAFESRRVMYLYHYFPGLLISYVLLALWWQRARERSARFARHGIGTLAAGIGAVLLCYLFFLPLSNHVPLTTAECEQRNVWISHILDCH